MSQTFAHTGDVDQKLSGALEAERSRWSIVSEIKRCHSPGQLLDAAKLLEAHPDFNAQKSIVLDLAYEEYCQRVEAGEQVESDAFCKRFRPFNESLYRLLEVHQYLLANQQLLPTWNVSWPEPGQIFAGFELIGELGRGAFARVYLAEETVLGRRLVAIKVSNDIAAEAEVLGKLEHPNIVPVHSVKHDAETGLTVLCMPYLGAVTLLDMLEALFVGGAPPTKARDILDVVRKRQGKLPPPVFSVADGLTLNRGSYLDGIVRLVSQLSDALAYSHSRGVCHLDLKPSNVLVTASGKPMLLDFNLASDSQRAERRLGGTLPYMSPEQLRAVVDRTGRGLSSVNGSSDVFSLGVITYELLTGTLPFGTFGSKDLNDEVVADVLDRQAAGPPSLRDMNVDIDSQLTDLIERCLAFDPRDRPQSAKILASQLRSTFSLGRRLRRWSRSHRSLLRWLAVACSAVCLLAAIHLATRDPYHVREFRRGLALYDQGQYREAEASFTRAIDENRAYAEALFWRARARQTCDRELFALEDYQKATELSPSPEVAASRAFCAAKAGVTGPAIALSHDAIRDGFASAEVYNNLGYAYSREGNFRQAVIALDEAIEQNPRLQAALHNRALAEFRWAVTEGRPVDVRACADIEEAIAEGPATPDLCVRAAHIYSRVAQAPGQYDEVIMAHLAHALRLGAAPETVRRGFRSVLDETLLESLSESSGSVTKPATAPRLADPITDRSFWRR